ncbi:hypothetical protein E8E11_010709 [Didymella keratinophila]|nr:hypothetical protein E8E11_010709 [Didymella keratinophila]
MRKELAAANREIINLKEKDENVLESMQQEQDHWEKNHEKEKIAQIDHLDECIRNLEADLQALLNSSQNGGDRLDTVRKLILDNDELRARIDALEKEKADIQKVLDTKDNESFGIMFETQVQEVGLNKVKASHDASQYTYSAAEQEKYYLRAAIREGEGGSLTYENKKLVNEKKGMMEERDEPRKNKKSVEAKARRKLSTSGESNVTTSKWRIGITQFPSPGVRPRPDAALHIVPRPSLNLADPVDLVRDLKYGAQRSS